ncbi:MAG TPA: hypothetical protein EYQ00_12785 [Dehalococcoidia bacterium]|nr:hypothetical protein [Dehalococcoidia bacterium]
MAITTYAELQTAVKNWSKRTDLDSIIPDFIRLAELRVNRNLRIRKMETRVTSDTVASQDYYGLPTNFLQMRGFKLNTSPLTDLDYLTPEMMDRTWAGSLTGKPRAYTIVGDEVRLGPKPDAAYTMEMLYYQAPTSLSDSNTSNFMLTANPDSLVYAALIELNSYSANDTAIIKYTQLFNEAINAIQT